MTHTQTRMLICLATSPQIFECITYKNISLQWNQFHFANEAMIASRFIQLPQFNWHQSFTSDSDDLWITHAQHWGGHVSKVAVKWKALLLRIYESLVSVPGPDTDYTDWRFSCFFFSQPGCSQNNSLNYAWTALFHIIFDSVFTRLSTIRCCMCLASNNVNERFIHKTDKDSDSFQVQNLWENTGNTFFDTIFSYIILMDWDAYPSNILSRCKSVD
jgi:hypothetical protein